jgi:hypothetical protein
LLVRKIWKFFGRIQMIKEGGRVGEALGASGPLFTKRNTSAEPRPEGWGPCESRGTAD